MGAAAIPIATTVIGGVMQQQGAKKQARAANAGNRMSEAARQEAKMMVSPQHIQNMGNWLFPNLLRSPEFTLPGRSNASAITPVTHGSPVPPQGLGKAFQGAYAEAARRQGATGQQPVAMAQPQAQPQAGPAASTPITPELMNAAAALMNAGLGRATGGSVEASTPYVVGEQGPEIVVPGQDGTVVPTPGAGTGQGINEQTQTGGYMAPVGGGGSYISPNASVVGGANFAENMAYGPSLGDLSMQHATNFLQNPGQLDTTSYERSQEQANQALNTNIQGAMGGLTGMGIDPRSAMGQTWIQNATMNAGRIRNEGARQLNEQAEALRRQDIMAGLTAYQNFLNQVFGIIGTQANTTGQGNFSNPQNLGNPYSGLAQAVTTGGKMAGEWLQNRKANKDQ